MEKSSTVETKKLKIRIDSKNTIINYGDITLYEGDFVTVEGPNGSGKSTFLKMIVNQIGDYCSLLDGDMTICGKKLSDYDEYQLRQSIVNIEQADPFTRSESAYFALRRSSDIALSQVEDKKAAKKKMDELICQFYRDYLIHFYHDETTDEKKLEKYKNNPHQDIQFMYLKPAARLSGGQQKMIHILQGIIKATVIGCKIVLMDEPLNNLDKENKRKLIQLIAMIRKKNPDLTILLITHCKVFPGVNTVLTINKGEGGYFASVSRNGDNKPYDCLK